MLKLTKNKIFYEILAFIILINILVLFNLNQFYIRAALGFIFLITIPGLLIMLMLKIREVGFWEYLVYVVGLSVSFIMFGGLAVNWILPLLNITDKPLSLYPILICFNIFLIAFWIIAWIRNKDLKPFEINMPKLDWTNRIFFIVPMLLPVLSILGAFLLNNRGPNYLTMIMLGGIAVYVFMMVLFRKKLNPNIYPWALYWISLALLLMFSLRSWYVSGWDISQEYYVFNLTMENSFWSMDYFRDAYNACLSLNILPKILISFSSIFNQMVFKILFQILFSFVPVILFLFFNIFYKKILSFLASFFLISTPNYMMEMPILARQEIAILFFSLILLVLFKNNFSRNKKILIICFSFSMIVSHYSTSYIALGILLFTFLISQIYIRSQQFNAKNSNKEKILGSSKLNLTGTLLFVIFIFAFLWYSQTTFLTGGLMNVLSDSIINIKDIFNEDLKQPGSSLINQFTLFSEQISPTNLLANYTLTKDLEYANKSYLSLYPEEITSKYPPKTSYPKVLPLKIDYSIFKSINLIGEILKKLIKLLILLSPISLIFLKVKSSLMKTEYLSISFGAATIIGLIITLPILSIKYPLGRLYLQALIILAVATIFCCLKVFWFIKSEPGRIKIVFLIFIAYFLFSTGFIQEITGGTQGNLNLNNFLESTMPLYVHNSEVKSAEWLSQNYDSSNFIYVDQFSSRKIFAFGGIYFHFEGMMPSLIDKNSYVYSSYTNIVEKKSATAHKMTALTYSFPEEFLNENKNNIYSTGESKILK
ncbi:DUF2206 domain-containing protein [Patescibacteria group bacterium]|nr:DUF2206 domain-containing protein [Patescibacteria group bacterium]